MVGKKNFLFPVSVEGSRNVFERPVKGKSISLSKIKLSKPCEKVKKQKKSVFG